MGKEMLKATRDPAFSQGPEGTDRAGNSVHSVQVESAVLDGPSGIRTSRLAGEPYPIRYHPPQVATLQDTALPMKRRKLLAPRQ